MSEPNNYLTLVEMAQSLAALKTDIANARSDWQAMHQELLAERKCRAETQDKCDRLREIIEMFIDADERVTPDGYMNALNAAKEVLGAQK